jgi:3',5'-cyclic AMP phosphodiesterase CpdA
VPWPRRVIAEDAKRERPLCFGLIADVHQDIVHDGERRLRAFIDAMNEREVDFIVQLGDFCLPHKRNKTFLDIFNAFDGPRYHVLGNHDMDEGFKRDQTMAFWDMPARYYSFDRGGVHFIVLDGNDTGGHSKGYARFMAEDQIKWLKDDLAAAKLPIVIFSHQPLDGRTESGVENHAAVRAVLEKANENAGLNKVIACISGHLHRDYIQTIKDIHYAQINSSSYHWLGADYARERYGREIHAAHPYIKFTLPYKEPIWAVVTVDHDRGVMQIEGRKSEFVGPTPWEPDEDRDAFDKDTIRPAMSDRQWSL